MYVAKSKVIYNRNEDLLNNDIILNDFGRWSQDLGTIKGIARTIIWRDVPEKSQMCVWQRTRTRG